ncbi:M20/M25/M40 family metallo-hydrolase [Sphingomonas jaspsi]|uniref:M20/M25/M40 family metallo-hydrolase n=1 Tax=Sphingomonas jaspsi TaxID=392409 RepID=UPI0004B0E0BF|nr:M20/M25/M40 family metallo-hydrolase [Sphingomonas jaspsi]
MNRFVRAGMLAATIFASPALAQSEPARIIDEGLNRSHVMLTASELMDGIGPRLTASPNLARAENWAIGKFTEYGLTNIHREPFAFGRGWEIVSSSATMVTPRRVAMTAIPVAWSPPTDGTLRAEVIVAPMSKREHFAKWKGKLAGKIVMVTLPDTQTADTKDPVFQRYDDAGLKEEDTFRLPNYDPDAINFRKQRRDFPRELDAFLKSEGAVAWIKKSYRDGMLVHGEGYNYGQGETLNLPVMEVAAEDYRRLARLAKTGPAPVIELNSNVRFIDGDGNANNIIADIPGTDPKAGYVMAGAHFDSWVAGDGAADNGAGSAVVIEAARILKAIGARPKRTIRFALWEGEEQGLLGSRAYIERHFVDRPVDQSLRGAEAYYSWTEAYPITRKPGYGEMKAYFNMDNGSGKFRGIYAEQNSAAVPILREWLSPYNALGADRIVIGKTGGTDHVYMQAVGIQGFQFIQDPLDYESRVHHSNLDTLDHMRGDDMRQAAVVMAGMLLAAANSDKVLPTMPIPQKPVDTDPFDYQDPNK